MRREMLSFAVGHVDGINVLIEIRLHPISQEPAVIRRQAEGKIISAGTFVNKTCLGEPGCVSARRYLLNVDVESAWIFSIGAEGDLLAIMAPTTEGMNCLWLPGQFLLDPTLTQAMIGAAAHSMNAE